MCGIFGALSYKDFIELYNLNKKRGDYQSSICCIKHNKGDTRNIHVTQVNGLFEENDVPKNYDTYLGHVRAPTQGLKEFDVSEAHPFIVDRYCVGHNGIIRNSSHLRKKYKILTPTTDSYLIPYLLSKYKGNIRETTKRIDGIYACWVVDIENADVSLFRCASSIYYDPKLKKFSSVKFRGSKMLKEGEVVTFPHFIIQDTFTYHSPYVILE